MNAPSPLSHLVHRFGVRCVAEPEHDPDPLASKRRSCWRVTLRARTEKRPTTLTWYGPKRLVGQPTALDVVRSLVASTHGVSTSYFHWCTVTGHRADSDVARQRYSAAILVRKALVDFFGDAWPAIETSDTEA